ncbi:MAG: HEAT repeat domain-containing protein [Candidatus Sulfotelmatobacter sp.]
MRSEKHSHREISMVGAVLLCSFYAQTQQLEGRFYPDKGSYMVGEPVLFNMEIKNTGKEVAYLNAKSPGKCLDTYEFSVAGPGLGCGANWNAECGDETVPLKPGDSYQGQWPLNFWYQFEREGTYAVDATRHIPVMSNRGDFQDFTFSSRFEVKLEPPDPLRVQRTLQEFEQKLHGSDPDVRHAALDVLSTTSALYFQGIALTLARGKDSFAALHAVGALERLNTAETRAALGDILTAEEPATDDEVLLRVHAIEALGHNGDASYQSLIGRYMDDKNEHIQQAAMVAIAQLEKAEAVPQLQRFSFSSNPVTRKNVASALRFSTTAESVQALIDLITDKDAGVREEALTSLAGLTGHSIGDVKAGQTSPEQLQNAWRAWWRENKGETHLPDRPEFVCHMK